MSLKLESVDIAQWAFTAHFTSTCIHARSYYLNLSVGYIFFLMVDPVSAILGIATSITALIKTGQTIYGWVQSLQDATGSLRELGMVLVEFNRLLANLQHDLDDEAVRLKIHPEETNVIIGDAKDTPQKLQSVIEGVRSDGIDARKIQWVLNERRCQSLQRRLARHRDSFRGIYNTTQIVKMSVVIQVSALVVRIGCIEALASR